MRGEDMKVELKPCPFCGGTDIESYEVNPGWTDPYWRIGCPDCGVWFEIAGWKEQDAAEAWNRRAGDAE